MSPRHVDPTTGKPLRNLYRENLAFGSAAKRFVRALAGRASRDVDALPLLRELAVYVDEQTREAVAACHAEGYSWDEIGERLGISRQSAWERYRSATPNGAQGRQVLPDGVAALHH